MLPRNSIPYLQSRGYAGYMRYGINNIELC
jgi:hypothetical protein